MRTFAFIVLILGVALAGGAVYYTTKFVDSQIGMMRSEPGVVRILAAKTRLEPNARIGASQLKWVEWPSDSVPNGVFTSTEALFGADGKDRRFAARTIEPNEPLLRSNISEPNAPATIRNLFEHRAMSIRISNETAVSGFITPGDHVDILLTRKVEDTLAASVLLQDVEVLAIDQTINSELNTTKVGRTATVAVTTREAQVLTLGQQIGQLSLTLIGQSGARGEAAPPVDLDDLNDLVKPPAQKDKTIRVRKQGVAEDIKIPD